MLDPKGKAGLQSSKIILGIDFTMSNLGEEVFICSTPNPYEQAISIIGRTLSPFDEDKLIPCFGFGNASTDDQSVFSFNPCNRYCHGFEEALARYREIVPHLKLSVGVGDGPWDAMKQFKDNIPQRAFDNFQFVNFTKIMSENKDTSEKAMAFARAALMQIRRQLRDAEELFINCTLPGHNGESCLYCRDRVTDLRTRPLPPPPEVTRHTRLHTSIPDSSPQTQETASAEPVCPICLTKPKNMAFGCGHMTCKDCGASLPTCPLCRKPITTRLRSYA